MQQSLKAPTNATIKTDMKTSEAWARYNLNDVEEQFDFDVNSATKKFRFYVEGIRCASCVHRLEELPQKNKNILLSQVNFGLKTLEIQVERQLQLGDLGQVIENMGFHPTPLNKDNGIIDARKKENRTDLKRIGVAAAVAGNQMLFAVPLYAGLQGDLAVVFKWISFTLFLPLLFYSARGFYHKAWSSLKSRQLNVDMMIVVALWSGFIFSSYSLLTGGEELYFDSTASFIFLILSARYFLKKYQERFAAKDIMSEMFLREIFDVEEQGVRRSVTFDKIKVGNHLFLKRGQTLPCDAILSSVDSEFDLSFLTGEAYPQKKQKGDLIRAGSRLLSQETTVVCETENSQTQLANLLNSLVQKQKNKSTYQNLSDIIAHRLTFTVFAIAGLFFLFTVQESGIEAFKRSLALITIACPCAVAFGTPLAQSMGLRKALEKGYFIRSSDVFEKLDQVKKIIFDKTGTLTSSHLKFIKSYPENISDEIKTIILGLEKNSVHPVAVSLKNAWSSVSPVAVENLHEISGFGVEGIVDGKVYRLGRSVTAEDENLQVDLTVDGRREAYLFFEEELRTEAKSLVQELYQQDMQVMLLSGDRRQRALEIARQLEIRPSAVHSDQSAESKQAVIEKENPCLYVGDGLNDLQALNAAYVSFAVRGPFEATYQVCDVFAPQKDLSAVVEMLEISRQVYRVIRGNLLFALVYNSIGGVLALGGYINPLMAAVLMPISSVLIISHTVWRMK